MVIVPRLRSILAPAASISPSALQLSRDRPLPSVPKDVLHVSNAALSFARTFPELVEAVLPIFRESQPDMRFVASKSDGQVQEQWRTLEVVLKQTAEELDSIGRGNTTVNR